MFDALGNRIEEGDRVVYLNLVNDVPRVQRATITRMSGSRIYLLPDNKSYQTWTVDTRVIKLTEEGTAQG